MRRIIYLLFMLLTVSSVTFAQERVEQDLFENLRTTDKAAVVAVHFGTSDAATRERTIEMFNIRMRREFPDCEFREAWTSRIVIRKLASRGVKIKTPAEVFADLKREGYTHVLVQSSNVIDGTEMQCLRKEVENVKADFKQIRLGEPLFSDVKDFEGVILATAASYGKEKTANVLVCHGSKGALNSAYTMLDYVLTDKGYDNWYVATIEGYPSYESLVDRMKKDKVKKVNLIPCLFVAGEHVKNDIAVDWKNNLNKSGFKVSVVEHGIGEVDGVLDIYMRHAKDARKYRTFTPLELKLHNSVK